MTALKEAKLLNALPVEGLDAHDELIEERGGPYVVPFKDRN